MLRSISSNWALNALQVAVFMVITPYAVGALGRDGYGVWEVVVATAGPLQLLALGLPMATVRAVSAAVADGDDGAASRAVGVSLTLTLALGALAALAGAAVIAAFDTFVARGPAWSGLSPDALRDARWALALLLANVAAGFALALPYAVYDAHHDFVARNLIKGGGLLIKLAATVAFLAIRPDVVALALVQVGVAVGEFTVAVALSRRRHPSVGFRPRLPRNGEARSLLSFSAFAFLLNMGALLAFKLDALVIGAQRPPEEAAIYGFGNKIFDPLINLLLGIGMVLMPLAAAAVRRGELDDLRETFLRWSKIASTVVLLMGVYLMVLGPEFLHAWLGEAYAPESGRLLQVLMASFFLFLPVRGVALPVLMGMGRARGPGIGLLLMGATNLGLSLALIGPLGLLGVALGTAIPNVLFSATFAVAACRELGVRPSAWFGYCFGRPLVAAAAAGGALLVARAALAPAGFPALIAVGVTYTALFGAILLVVDVRRDPRFAGSLPAPLRRAVA